eukprot:scaffold173038_cov30-Tisochrysis_lutea.AAC.1
MRTVVYLCVDLTVRLVRRVGEDDVPCAVLQVGDDGRVVDQCAVAVWVGRGHALARMGWDAGTVHWWRRAATAGMCSVMKAGFGIGRRVVGVV